jgi:hypothetical protein
VRDTEHKRVKRPHKAAYCSQLFRRGTTSSLGHGKGVHGSVLVHVIQSGDCMRARAVATRETAERKEAG